MEANAKPNMVDIAAKVPALDFIVVLVCVCETLFNIKVYLDTFQYLGIYESRRNLNKRSYEDRTVWIIRSIDYK